MVPYKFLKCLSYICEICHWYYNRYCNEFINCFGLYGHFDDVHENIGRKISDIPRSNVFTDMSPRARDIKERIKKWDLIT